jgi:hypothetical protein
VEAKPTPFLPLNSTVKRLCPKLAAAATEQRIAAQFA